MIVPIVREEEWREVLCSLPDVAVVPKRVVLVAPHPDDEVLGVGAFLAARQAGRAEVLVAAVTDGENAYAENTGLAETRRQEQTAALGRLGIGAADIHRFGLTDSAVAAQSERLVELLLPLVTADTCLIAPWTGDFHPDHEACGRAAQTVAEKTGAALWWYFFWTWHRGTPLTVRDLDLRLFHFDDALLETKLNALACHRSQLARDNGDPILTERLLAPARRSFEVFAPA